MLFEEFLRDFPHEVKKFNKNHFSIKTIIKVNLEFNPKKYQISLRFVTDEFSEDMLNQFTEKIKSDFYLIRNIKQFTISDYLFVIRKFEDLYKVIEILDSYFLMARMSK